MAYDEDLAGRCRAALRRRGVAFTEKKMFGGLCLLHAGNMIGGVLGETLMLRVGGDRYEALLARDHVREMDFTGRRMRGMIYVDPDGTVDAAGLDGWLGEALAFVTSLPPKD